MHLVSLSGLTISPQLCSAALRGAALAWPVFEGSAYWGYLALLLLNWALSIWQTMPWSAFGQISRCLHSLLCGWHMLNRYPQLQDKH